jgi:glutathione peroxidase
MIKAILLFALLTYPGLNGIYDYQITAIDGSIIHLGDFAGKKILFVNTATNSDYVDQYGSLETLYQKFKDSLVVIAVPSNSFGHEPDSNQAIRDFIMSHYNVHYIIAAKMNVAGDSIEPVYQWLADSTLNQSVQNPVNGDFYKYLVNGSGRITGVFSEAVDPMDTSFQQTIQNQ